MTYLITMPSSFGQFSPHTNYVGYKEELEEYYLTKLPTNDRERFRTFVDYSYHVSKKFKNEPTYDFDPITKRMIPFTGEYERLAPHEMPRKFAFERKQSKPLGSMFETINRMIVVDGALKSIIEGLEPDVHLFWPVSMVQPKGDPFPGEYYGLQVGRMLQAIDPEHSKEGSLEIYYNSDKTPNGLHGIKKWPEDLTSGVAISRAIAQGAHLWQEENIGGDPMLISDTLRDAIKAAGLRFPKLTKMKDI